MTEPTTATLLMDDIIRRYKLSRFYENEFRRSSELRLVLATSQSVVFFAYQRWNATLFTLECADSKDIIYSLTSVPGHMGDRIAFTTYQGTLYVVDSHGALVKEQTVSNKNLWFVKHARLGRRSYLFACCTDHTIRIFDNLGEPLCAIETPGRILSIDVKEIGGRVRMAGGVQSGKQVYLWDLDEMTSKLDATPQVTLRGGRKPAFSTKFIDIGGEPWIAHGCWDNNVYLYDWSYKDSGKAASPRLVFRGSSPVYPIQQIIIQGHPILVAGTEAGDIFAWSLTTLRDGKGPDYTIARLGLRVKCITVAEIDGQPMLFAGCDQGQLCIIELDNPETPRLLAIMETGRGEIRGIGLVSL